MAHSEYGIGQRGESIEQRAEGKRSAALEERPARRDLRQEAKRDVG